MFKCVLETCKRSAFSCERNINLNNLNRKSNNSHELDQLYNMIKCPILYIMSHFHNPYEFVKSV